MHFSRELLDEVVAHARAEAPNECCGIVATRDGRAVAVHRARNSLASPLRYELDPRDQLRIQDEIDAAGLEMGVIYHSHTRSDPVPSQTDINLARFGDEQRFPGTLYLIAGVKDPGTDDLRLWQIVGDEVTQVELQVEG